MKVKFIATELIHQISRQHECTLQADSGEGQPQSSLSYMHHQPTKTPVQLKTTQAFKAAW